ncbi:hypothetical protein, partial [Gilvibacter sp.]|uniref:hypothetical protein n=1 Tax=Gilvibacter sp. TaxID=2729997 RepID=UPI0025BE3338
AVHAPAPDGTRYTTTATTDASGNFTFTLSSDKPFGPDDYKVIAYVLPGSVLGSSESPPINLQIQ